MSGKKEEDPVKKKLWELHTALRQAIGAYAFFDGNQYQPLWVSQAEALLKKVKAELGIKE